MKKFFGTLLLVLMCVSVIEPAFADLGSLRKKADEGDLQAMTDLGAAYIEGDGITKSVKLGMKYIKPAAEKNHPEAMYYMGKIYEDGGTGVKKDYKEAVKWYKKAAEKGHVAAESALGIMYYEGRGVKKDKKQAEYWLNKAAKQGDSDALYNLAVICEDKGDIKNAIELYGLAANQGDDDAKEKLEAYGNKGSSSAQYKLGVAYYNEKIYTAARSWIEKAATNNIVDAQYLLGMMYAQGLGGSQSFKEGEYWLTIAAKNGSAEAQNQLASVSKQANHQRNLEAQQAEAAKRQAEAKRKERAASLMNDARNNCWASDYPANVGYGPIGRQLEKYFNNTSWSLESDRDREPVAVFQGVGRYEGRKAMFKVTFCRSDNGNVYIDSIKINDSSMYYNSLAGLNALSDLLGAKRPGYNNLYSTDMNAFYKAFLAAIYGDE